MQLNLMAQKEFDYSTEMISSSSKDYRLLKDSENIILPRLSTIKRLILLIHMNHLIEQQYYLY